MVLHYLIDGEAILNRKCLFFLFLLALPLLAYSRPVRVYADISGDLFHAGHVAFLKRAKAFGDELVIGVLSDEDIESYKRTPILTLQERVTVIEACRYVDEVIAAPPLCASKQWLKEHQIDVVVHGDDFDPTSSLAMSQYGPAIEMGIFVTVPYTKGISTTEIIKRVQQRVNP